MHTRLLMTGSALFTGLLGVAATFLPQEILSATGAAPATTTVVLVQVAGALYLGFAMLNWTAKGVLIGGIYSRPVALGNFLHFAMVTMLMLKMLPGQESLPVIAGIFVYAVFAVWFGLVLFRSPVAAGGP